MTAKITHDTKRFLSPVKRFFNNRSDKILLSAISKLPSIEQGLTLMDIGAAGEIEPRWKRIEPIINYVGFEPDERSRSMLVEVRNNCLNYKILPFAVWDSVGPVTINLCRTPQVSSHYSPNRSFLDLFPASPRFDVVSTASLEAMKLDNLGLESPDFIKIDIQGGELSALKGGQRLLEDALGLELEVEFLPLYVEQPLFGEICSFLSKSGFEFIDFVNLCRWERGAHNGFGQCVFGDGLFLRSPEAVLSNRAIDDRTISKYLAICLTYNRFDLIDRIIHLLPELRATNYSAFIKAIERVRQMDQFVRNLNRILTFTIGMVGSNYRSHLIY